MKINKYIKNKSESVPMTTTTVNIKKTHLEFLKNKNLNLSAMVRDLIESAIQKQGEN